jgi:hypothetical protein
MGSSAMINIPSFIKIGSGIQKLMRGEIHREDGELRSMLLFFENKESGLEMVMTLVVH